MRLRRAAAQILASIKRRNGSYEVCDDEVIELLEILVEQSHAPVPIAEAVRKVLDERATPLSNDLL